MPGYKFTDEELVDIVQFLPFKLNALNYSRHAPAYSKCYFVDAVYKFPIYIAGWAITTGAARIERAAMGVSRLYKTQ